MRWAKHGSGSRKHFLPQLMEHVRVRLSEALPFHIIKSEELIPQKNRKKPGYGDKVLYSYNIFLFPMYLTI